MPKISWQNIYSKAKRLKIGAYTKGEAKDDYVFALHTIWKKLFSPIQTG